MSSVVALAALLVAAMALSACGGGTGSPAATADAPPASEAPAGGGAGAGEALGQKILATFDELVADVAQAAKAKPAPAELKPALESIYATYAPTMASLNSEYRALRDADITEFGACNTYLGSERGTRVAAKDATLTDAVRYYNLELGDQEIVALLSARPVELLELAVKQD
ncbi:MAG: hypothetical protein MUC54_04360 [Chloroflexi bacterium]|nr:hypothetical protein [Chloroflexota bacterium]